MENTPTYKFTKSGRADYMGFTWFKVIKDGKPLIKGGVVVKVKALDAEHARAIVNQIPSAF